MNSQLYMTSLIALVVFLCSCSGGTKQSNNESKVEKSNIVAKITRPAGEKLTDSTRLDIPTFFNIAQVEGQSSKINAIILGPKISRGKSIDIHPLAIFKFNRDSLLIKYLVSVPSSLDNKAIGNNYLTFMSMNNELCLAVENWFKAQCGLNNCSSFKWDNPQKTILQLY